MLFAMIFPGQGSLNVHNTFKCLNSSSLKIVKNTFEEASEIIKLNLWDIFFYSKNKNHSYIQIVILTISVAIYRMWMTITGIKPTIMAGHSLGEYSALVCCNILSFSEAVKIIHAREKIMTFACKNFEGSMLTIKGLKLENIKKLIILNFPNPAISIACINSRTNIVVSGKIKYIKKMQLLCEKYGAKFTKILPIHIAAHSYLMKPAAKRLYKLIKKVKFHNPVCPIVNNTSIKCETSSIFIKKSLIQQLYKPVRWIEVMQYIFSKKIKLFLEIGSSSILTHLNKDINGITSISLYKMSNFLKAFKILSKKS
ncbi:ACP S-malonyltransferase [Buchnera aphidicola]|uniref:Malonyl CoA-acyl carrier protein transacylase n=1 Tax=Buchnera aphidicola (Anoecia oenotherae) TaxID=1241833 RepID=A0A4D6XY61_9GAMM|nr:acyltransferase domain-containing protein [Buchnera aphidicola]QCI19398.1 acyltransferase domain-containing protein [Buchnera aphidicola (Anoecia oenotherae)]